MHRAPFHPAQPGTRGGDPGGRALRAALGDCGAVHLRGRTVWHVSPGFILSCLSEQGCARGDRGTEEVHAPRLILAPGTVERIVACPRQHAPGRDRPRRGDESCSRPIAPFPPDRSSWLGPGRCSTPSPRGSSGRGGAVAAIVDLARPGAWPAACPQCVADRGSCGRARAGVAEVRRAGVPLRFGHAVTAVEGEGRVAAVRLAPVDADWRARPGRGGADSSVRPRPRSRSLAVLRDRRGAGGRNRLRPGERGSTCRAWTRPRRQRFPVSTLRGTGAGIAGGRGRRPRRSAGRPGGGSGRWRARRGGLRAALGARDPGA